MGQNLPRSPTLTERGRHIRGSSTLGRLLQAFPAAAEREATSRCDPPGPKPTAGRLYLWTRKA
jgi:hypothetical protein